MSARSSKSQSLGVLEKGQTWRVDVRLIETKVCPAGKSEGYRLGWSGIKEAEESGTVLGARMKWPTVKSSGELSTVPLRHPGHLISPNHRALSRGSS